MLSDIPSVFVLFLCSNQWILDPQILMRDRQKDLTILTEEEYQRVMIFYCNSK